MKKKQIYFWIGLHAFVLVVVFSLLLVVKPGSSGRSELPLMPKSLMETESARWFALNMVAVGADLWIYHGEADYILRGNIESRFLSYKANTMEGTILPSSDPKRVRLPYRDISFEYPPVAALFILLPGLFSSDLYQYRILYSLLASSFFLGTLWILTRIYKDLPSDLFPPSKLNMILAASLVFTLCFGPIIVYRLDVFPVFFVTLALRAAQKKQNAGAGAFLALGVATKLYPLILFPLFLLYAFRSTSWREPLRLTFGFLVTLLLIYIPVLILAPQGYLQSLGYHSERGVEIESLWASWAQIRHLLGTPAEVYSKYGSKNIFWSGEEWVKNSWTYFALAILGLIYFQSFLKLNRRDPKIHTAPFPFYTLIHSSLLLLLGLMITSKVLSNQFILWLYPLFLWIGLQKKFVFPLYFQIALASQAIYPYLFTDLVHLKNHAIVVLAWRNLLLLVLFLRLMDWALLVQGLRGIWIQVNPWKRAVPS
jgi:glycosyl transferase family 87